VGGVSPARCKWGKETPRPDADADVGEVSPVPVQMWQAGRPVPAQMWAGVSPVPVQMLHQGRAQSRRLSVSSACRGFGGGA